jgi:hypothetical protein
MDIKHMKTYNGYRSWNAWNVALWVHDDLDTHELATLCRRRYKRVSAAAGMMLRALGPKARTPDGASYNKMNITIALNELKAEDLAIGVNISGIDRVRS